MGVVRRLVWYDRGKIQKNSLAGTLECDRWADLMGGFRWGMGQRVVLDQLRKKFLSAVFAYAKCMHFA